MGHRLGLATRTQISVCKSPFSSAGTAVSLFRAKMVQQRPLLPREVENTNETSQCGPDGRHVNLQYVDVTSPVALAAHSHQQ